MSYVKKHKWHLVILIVLLLIAGVSGYFSMTHDTDSTTQTPNTNSQTPTNGLQDTGYKLHVTSSKIQDTNKTQTINPNNQTATNTLQDTGYRIQVTGTSTVYDAMQNSQLDFKTKTFSGLGEFVEEIGGLKNDPQEGKYWIYFINGETAKLGISTQIVVPGDLIEWKYGNTDL